MPNANAFSFRPAVEQLADRTMPSVSLVTPEPVAVRTDTAVSASHAADDVSATWALKPTAQVQGRKAGEGQKDW